MVILPILFGPLIDTRSCASSTTSGVPHVNMVYSSNIIIIVVYIVYTILYSSNHSNKKIIIIIILHAAAYNRENVSVECLHYYYYDDYYSAHLFSRCVDYRTYWAKSNGNTTHKYIRMQQEIFEIPTNIGVFFKQTTGGSNKKIQ